MDGVVDSPESIGASSSTRVQKKRRPKLFPDEAETAYRVKYDDDNHESDVADPRVRLFSSYPSQETQADDDDDGITVVLPPL